jgi:hypothetical protein
MLVVRGERICSEGLTFHEQKEAHPVNSLQVQMKVASGKKSKPAQCIRS